MNGMWRICTNQVLINLYRGPDIISEIRKGQLQLVRTCGKNVRRKNGDEGVEEYPKRKKSLSQSHKRDGRMMLKMI
jgi:hypothetical protein